MYDHTTNRTEGGGEIEEAVGTKYLLNKCGKGASATACLRGIKQWPPRKEAILKPARAKTTGPLLIDSQVFSGFNDLSTCGTDLVI